MYFALPNIALGVGDWLLHTGDVWKRASHTRRIFDVVALVLLVVGFIYKPLLTCIALVPIGSTLSALEE